MSNPALTTGQLERLLAQNIRKRYRQILGHNPKKVSCKVADTQLTIIIEEPITKLESFLLVNEQKFIADYVRSDLEQALLPVLRATILDCLDINVLDIGSISMENTNSTAVVAVLEQSPDMSAYRTAS